MEKLRAGGGFSASDRSFSIWTGCGWGDVCPAECFFIFILYIIFHRVSQQRGGGFITVFTQQPSDCWQRTFKLDGQNIPRLRLWPIETRTCKRTYTHTHIHTHLSHLLTYCLLLHFLHCIFISLVFLLECGPFYSVVCFNMCLILCSIFILNWI